MADVKNSIAKKKVIDEGKFAANALDCLVKNNHVDFIKVLENRFDPRYELICKLAIVSFGKGKIDSLEEAKIPAALKTVLKFTPHPMGLFSSPNKSYGPGASRVLHPYEVLTAAAIVQQRKIYSKEGKVLRLYDLDQLVLGHKSAANYAQPRRFGTIESDVLIQRADIDIAPTGIDAKYSKNGVYEFYDETERQLRGVRKAINDGQLKDFFYMTNGQFSGKFQDKVSDYNIMLTKDWVKNNKENHSIKETSKEYIEKNFRQLVKDYIIPQINICENVSFKT